jgi:hypothetical protein
LNFFFLKQKEITPKIHIPDNANAALSSICDFSETMLFTFLSIPNPSYSSSLTSSVSVEPPFIPSSLIVVWKGSGVAAKYNLLSSLKSDKLQTSDVNAIQVGLVSTSPSLLWNFPSAVTAVGNSSGNLLSFQFLQILFFIYFL